MSDYIDEKALEEFRGCVVRKDLAPLIKGGANTAHTITPHLTQLDNYALLNTHNISSMHGSATKCLPW